MKLLIMPQSLSLCWTLVAARGGRDASHAGAARPSAMAVITASRGRSPLKALLAPLVAAFDTLLGTVHGDVGRCLPVAARCRLPASLCRAKRDYLIVGGALGGDAVWLLKHVPEEVAMFALPQALCMVLRQSAYAALAISAVNLGLAAPTLLAPQWGLG
jgi:hypothetical protein